MTRKEIIKEIKIYKQDKTFEMSEEVVDFIISSLETDEAYQLEYESTTKNDLGVDAVSRQEVDRLACRYLKEPTDNHVAFYEHFLALPSVTPQESFINKPCVSEKVCEHDKQMILDKIRAEISCNIIDDDTSGNTPAKLRADWAAANKAHMIDIAILDKYRSESETV